MDKYELEKDKDALFRGEFEVVRELVAALPEGDVSNLNYLFATDEKSWKETDFNLSLGHLSNLKPRNIQENSHQSLKNILIF